MNEIICRSISNGREFKVLNDYFRSPHTLRSECNSYTLAETKYTELLSEHDKQIRADAIDEFMKVLCEDCKKQPCYGDECYQKQIAERLKGKTLKL